jgi:hypothetical protein
MNEMESHWGILILLFYFAGNSKVVKSNKHNENENQWGSHIVLMKVQCAQSLWKVTIL